VTPHSFTAKALYGSGQTSTAHTFTVKSELIVDITPLHLTGANISIAGTTLPWTRISDPTGTVAARPATGGQPPYTYETSNRLVASVDGNGVVRSTGNGTANITVKDSAGQSKNIPVTASRVQRLIHYGDITLLHSEYVGGVTADPGRSTLTTYQGIIEFISLLNTLFTYRHSGLTPYYHITSIIAGTGSTYTLSADAPGRFQQSIRPTNIRYQSISMATQPLG